MNVTSIVENSNAEKKLKRVLSVSRINGWSIAGFAGLCAILVLLLGDLFGFAVGIAVAFGGYMELRGNFLLLKKTPKAFHWLIASQLYLMLVLWIYCFYNLAEFDPSDPWARFPPGFKEMILAVNPDQHLVEELAGISYYATYLAVIMAVLIYQGGLCLYYLSRKKYLYPVCQ